MLSTTILDKAFSPMDGGTEAQYKKMSSGAKEGAYVVVASSAK